MFKFNEDGFTKSNDNLRQEFVKIFNKKASSLYFTYINILARKMDDNNKDCCFPSIEEISNECGIGERQIKTNIKELKDKGFLIVASGKTGRNNNYYFPQEKGLYTDNDLKYIQKIKENNNKSIDKNITTEENNNVNSCDDTIFNNDDKDEISPINEDLTVKSNDTIIGDINNFYSNVHSYFNVDDSTIKTNKIIIKKLNDLTSYVDGKLKENNITVPADKVFDDIIVNNSINTISY